MTGSVNWRRQRCAVELGWRTGTDLLQICARWSAHWVRPVGGIRQICAFTRLGAVTRWCWSLKAFFMGVNGCLIG